LVVRVVPYDECGCRSERERSSLGGPAPGAAAAGRACVEVGRALPAGTSTHASTPRPVPLGLSISLQQEPLDARPVRATARRSEGSRPLDGRTSDIHPDTDV
jgi:hypothetical protein